MAKNPMMKKGGKMPMVMKDGKKVPAFAADGKGKRNEKEIIWQRQYEEQQTIIQNQETKIQELETLIQSLVCRIEVLENN